MRRSREGEHIPFYEKPVCSVQNRHGDSRRRPIVKATDDDLIVYFRLCKGGYASGITEAKTLDARTVIQALHYDGFLADWDTTFIEVNKE